MAAIGRSRGPTGREVRDDADSTWGNGPTGVRRFRACRHGRRPAGRQPGTEEADRAAAGSHHSGANRLRAGTARGPGHIGDVDIRNRGAAGPADSGAHPAAVAPIPAPITAPIVPAAIDPVVPAPIPSAVTPPAPTLPPIAMSELSKQKPLTLAALERMALARSQTQAPMPASRGTLVPTGGWYGQDGTMADDGDVPHGFVDKVAPRGGSMTPELLAQQYRTINGIRLRYYHLLALQKLISVREDLAGISRDAVAAIDAMTAAGQATKAELLQARVEAREQMAALQNVRSVHQTVWQRMATTIGQPDLPIGPVTGDLEQSCAVPTIDVALVHLLETSPELQTVRNEVARRQAALRQNLSGSGTKTANVEKPESDGLISQAIAVFSNPAATHEQKVKQADWTDLSRFEAEVGRVQQSLKQRLADSYARLDHAKEIVDLYRTQNLADAKEAFELSVIGYRQGRGSWPQVQIAQRNYFRMSVEYVEALAQMRRAEVEILSLLLNGPENPASPPAVHLN